MNDILFFDEVLAKEIRLTGGKGSNLSKMTQAGFPVPFGFIVTAEAYQAFISGAKFLAALLMKLDYNRPDVLVKS